MGFYADYVFPRLMELCLGTANSTSSGNRPWLPRMETFWKSGQAGLRLGLLDRFRMPGIPRIAGEMYRGIATPH